MPERHGLRLLMLGRHSPPQEGRTLFAALAQLKEKLWSIDLVVRMRQTSAPVQELGLTERVIGYRPV